MRGHLCLHIPTYNCELSLIERFWCFAKKHTRAYAHGRITKLRKFVPEGLSMCSTTTIQKYFIVETMNKHIEMDKLGKM